jgi:5-methyltetrahydropteroyltriglutamate--homocysteine methyltransferase
VKPVLARNRRSLSCCILAGTDCGFAPATQVRRVHPSIQWAKLEALSAGARLASRELWGAA